MGDDARVGKLLERIAGLELLLAATEWRECSPQSMPEPGVPILFVAGIDCDIGKGPHQGYMTLSHYGGVPCFHHYRSGYTIFDAADVTHWMPMPELP
jgi:hypothetical protein